MSFAKGELAGKVELGGYDGLAAAAQLLHAQCFDRVALGTPPLSSEPRSSCHCKDCGAVWIAWKSGDVMCIDLNRDQPLQSADRGNRAARTIYHLHDGAALGGGSFLLVGRDDGELDIVPCPARGPRPAPAPRLPPPRPFYLDSWYPGSEPRDVSAGFESSGEPMGITAIAAVSWGRCDALDILVATRRPALYVIEATRGTLAIRKRRRMPGWIQWILVDGDRVTCVSRGGDIVRFTRETLVADGDPPCSQVSLLPTAAMAFGRGGVLLGTMKGLFLVRDGQGPLAVPVTQSPVLCLARAEVTPSDRITHDYITMGLEGGRLRVADAELVQALADGIAPPPDHDHNFGIAIGDAVLAVETLQLDPASPHTAHVLTMTRDQSVRLFHVTSQETQRNQVRQLWQEHLAAHGVTGFAAERDLIRASLRDSDRAWWRYMLADVVLPDLAKKVPDCIAYGEIVELARAIADRTERTDPSDRFALYALSAGLQELTGGDVDLQLALSHSILRAVPRNNDRRWTAFIESHLGELNALRRPDSDDDFERRVQWSRFVRKFILLGHTFAAKRIGLGKLVEQNYRIGKYLDALIYQARLFQRRYDLQWESRTDDIAELHAVDCGGGPGIVVIVTVDGKVGFADGETGQPLAVPGARGDRLTAIADGETARSLASAVVALRDDPRALPGETTFRVVLATDARPSTPATTAPNAADKRRRRDTSEPAYADGWLAVFELKWSPKARGVVEVIARTPCVVCEPRGVRVRAVKPLPPPGPRPEPPAASCPDAFVVGLETSAARVGLLSRTGGVWGLELASDGATERSDDGSPRAFELSLAPGKMPTRGLAVGYDDHAERYLVVAGSDDGVVRAISFSKDDRASSWQVKPWDRVPDAVNTVALIGNSEKANSRFSCYLGTAGGHTYALSILARSKRKGRSSASSGDHEASTTVLAFGDYDAQALWRDTHEGPVLRACVWRTPLYRPVNAPVTPPDRRDTSDVLVVATESGRLCFYRHFRSVPPDGASYEYSAPDRHSASCNYYFRGLRLDRLTMPTRLRAVTMLGDNRFVAAGPRELYMGELVFLRNSKDRPIPEYRRATPSGSTSDREASAQRSGPPQPLPSEIWPRLGHLFWCSRIAQPFNEVKNGRRVEELKLDLCDLLRLEGGALAAYILRMRWPKEEWRQRHGDELRGTVHRLLDPLDPEQREDAERIKIIIKSLCRAFLFHDPDTIKREILSGIDPMSVHHAQIAVVCDFLASYVRFDLAASTSASARLRVVVIKELLRVATLRRMVWRSQHGDKNSECIHDAVGSVLETCLHDDNPLVRIEAMRALSVMLRNVGMMAGSHDAPARKPVLDALFPSGLASLDWVLRSTVGGLLRFPSFTGRTALFSGAWHLIWGLLQLFHLFPDRTLALSDYLIREGLGVEVLAMCARSLRGEELASIRHRIEYLYLLPARSRNEFVRCYHIETESQTELVEAMKLPERGPRVTPWHQLDDAVMASVLGELLYRLARMWEVKNYEKMADEVATCSFLASAGDTASLVVAGTAGAAGDEGPATAAPLAWLKHIVNELAAVAERLVAGAADATGEFKRLGALLEQPGDPGGDGGAKSTAPIRAVVSGIVEQWRTIFKPPLQVGSAVSSIYRLVAFDAGASNALWNVFAISGPHLKDNHDIKVFRQPNTKQALQRFLKGAKVNHDLFKKDRDHLVEVKEVIEEDSAYIVRRYDGALEDYLTNDFVTRNDAIRGRDALTCAAMVARQIGHALHTVHGANHYHGDVRAAHILLSSPRGVLEFRLGDFYQADPPASTVVGPRSIVPNHLARLCEHRKPSQWTHDAALSLVQWKDVAALSLVLYRMLTGERIDPCSDANLEAPIRNLQALGNHDRVMGRPEARQVVETVMRVFNGEILDIHAFHESLEPKTRLLWLMANPIASTSYPRLSGPLDLEGELADIKQLIGSHPGKIEFSYHHAVDPEALLTHVSTQRTSIVHFSGHGTEEGILLRGARKVHEVGTDRDVHGESGAGDVHEVTGEALSAAFERWRPRLVVLNACYSDAHARILSQTVPAVVGTTHQVKDAAARGFSLAFYRQLLAGATVRAAFDIARNADTTGARRVFCSHGTLDIRLVE